jgi:hypothetical protein
MRFLVLAPRVRASRPGPRRGPGACRRSDMSNSRRPLTLGSLRPKTERSLRSRFGLSCTPTGPSRRCRRRAAAEMDDICWSSGSPAETPRRVRNEVRSAPYAVRYRRGAYRAGRIMARRECLVSPIGRPTTGTRWLPGRRHRGAESLTAKISIANCTTLAPRRTHEADNRYRQDCLGAPASKATSTVPATWGRSRASRPTATLSGSVAAGTVKGRRGATLVAAFATCSPSDNTRACP